MLAGLEDSEFGRAHAAELLAAAAAERAGEACRPDRLGLARANWPAGRRQDLAKLLPNEGADSQAAPAARRARSATCPGCRRPARLDRRTKSLTRRLPPGDIAIIDHADLDRVSAETLVSARSPP